MTTKEIYDALCTAAREHALRVDAHPDLGGASVSGRSVQAYVYPQASGYEVDLWRKAAAEAFLIDTLEDLDSAVTLAVASARGQARRGKG